MPKSPKDHHRKKSRSSSRHRYSKHKHSKRSSSPKKYKNSHHSPKTTHYSHKSSSSHHKSISKRNFAESKRTHSKKYSKPNYHRRRSSSSDSKKSVSSSSSNEFINKTAVIAAEKWRKMQEKKKSKNEIPQKEKSQDEGQSKNIQKEVHNEEDMMIENIFGISSFSTSKNQSHKNTSIEGMSKNSSMKRHYRQYMNRQVGSIGLWIKLVILCHSSLFYLENINII